MCIVAGLLSVGLLCPLAQANPGDLYIGNPGAGNLQLVNNYTKLGGPVITPALNYRHDGPVWKIESGATYSDATSHYRDAEKGFVNTPSLTLTGITMRFDDIRPDVSIPQTVTATTATGAPLDWASLAPYRINNIVFNEQNGRDLVTSPVERIDRPAKALVAAYPEVPEPPPTRRERRR